MNKSYSHALKVLSAIIVVFAFVSLTSAADFFSLGNYQVRESGLTVTDESGITLPGNFVITGLGIGMSYNPDRSNAGEVGSYVMKPILIVARELMNDGSFGPEKEFLTGSKSNVEKTIRLSSGYLITGWGAKVQQGADWSSSRIIYLEVRARKLNNNTLGPEEVFKAGNIDKNADRIIKLDDGFVATYIGGRVAHASLTKASIGGQKLLVNNNQIIINNTNQTTNPNQTTNDTISLTIINPNIVAREGDLVRINFAAFSTGGSLSFFISSPFNSTFTSATDNEGWQTKIGDAGSYIVNFTAKNEKNSATIKVNVTILPFINNTNNQTNNQTNNSNNAPIIRSVRYTGDEEGDTFRIIVDAYDPDNNTLTTTCSSPFGNDCKWETEEGDADDYNVLVTVSDGTLSTSRTIKVVVDEYDNDDSDGSGIRHVGEFQDNDLAYNNLLYNSQDAMQDSTKLNMPEESYNIISSAKSSNIFALMTLFLSLIVVLIVVIILTILYKRAN
ncbi:MAG: hypothetical protein AABW73_02755 [Nanoarchaeota archaeon]